MAAWPHSLLLRQTLILTLARPDALITATSAYRTVLIPKLYKFEQSLLLGLGFVSKPE